MTKPSSHFTKKFLDEQKAMLLQHKQDILNKLETNQEEPISPDQLVEDGDQAQAYLDQNVSIGLKERDAWRLREINYALNKLDQGSYGICEDMEVPIGQERLKKMPWTRLCIEAAEDNERSRGRLRGMN